MIVDNDNFDLVKGQIIQEIQQADFISFDLELTGIRGEYQDIFEEFPFERYLKLRRVSMKFNIIQVGLCMFKNNTAKAYTIYLFPQDQDEVIGLQVGAVNFNVDNGMDWNRWIRKGIGYVNEASFKKLYEGTQQVEQQEDYKQFYQTMKPNDKIQADKLTQDIDNFIKSQETEILIETKNGYQRKIVHSYIQQHQQVIKENRDGKMYLKKSNQDEIQQFAQQLQDKRDQKILDKTGFVQIWEKLIASKKTMVGHNCFGDIMFMYSHFIGCPPITYEQFKEEIHQRIPRIIDTKYVYQFSPSIKNIREMNDVNSSVENIYNILKSQNNSIDVQNNIDQHQYHDAGFDAYVTGYNYLNIVQNLSKEELSKQLNKLYLFKSNYCINLEGQDIKLNNIQFLVIKNIEQQNNKIIQQQNNKKKQPIFEKQDEIYQIFYKYHTNPKIIHNRYIYVEINNEQEFEKLHQELRNYQFDGKDIQVFNEKQYIHERRELREKDARLDKLEKR
ncbi:hypothetical protein pb186bvf_019653 [Paramecium bursaria]